MAEHQDVCEFDELLPQLLLGKLPREQRISLEEHLLTCRNCSERLAGIIAEDTLVEAARSPATLPDWRGDARMQTLFNRLCSLPITSTGFALNNASADDDLHELQRFLAPAQSSDELGRIGKYRVLKVLGAGGMGLVLEAEDTQLGRRVALKVMKRPLSAKSAAKMRFLREARAAAAVQHDHVVTIYDVDECNGLPYLAMQLLSGESLQQRLARQGRLPPADAVRIARQIALGLSAAHQQGVVHRDIKPDNIWLESPNDRVKILDFGLARVADDEVALTQSGAIAGTPSYMSPEQARGEPIDQRADLFSLGCVVYRMCSRRTAFSGNNTAALLLAVTQEEPPPLASLSPDAPLGLSDLVEKLLRKDPRRRVQSADEVAVALDEIEKNGANPAHRLHPRRWRTGRVILLGGALIGLFVIAALAWRLVANRARPSHEMDQSVAAVSQTPPQTPQQTIRPPIKASILSLSGSDAALDWVRSNAKLEPKSFLLNKLSTIMQQDLPVDHGFAFYIGRALTRSGKMAILEADNGHFFACEFFYPKEYPDTFAYSRDGGKNLKRDTTEAKLIELHIDNADDLDRDKEIHGSLKLQAICDKKGKYGIHLACWSLFSIQPIEWTPDGSHGVERIELQALPLKNVDRDGPILVFVELVRFSERDGEQFVVVSDPLPALVDVAYRPSIH